MGFRHIIKHLLWFILAGVLIGCETQATPVAIAPDSTASVAPVTTRDLATPLESSGVNTVTYGVDRKIVALFEQLPRVDNLNWLALDAPENVDIWISEDGTISLPITIYYQVLVNESLAPLNDPLVLNILETLLPALETPDTELAATLRASLANTGHPDGYVLTVASFSPSSFNHLQSRLSSGNLESVQLNLETQSDLEQVFLENRAHLLLLPIFEDLSPPDWAQAYQQIEIPFTSQLTYQVLNPNLSLEFNESGIPVIVPNS